MLLHSKSIAGRGRHRAPRPFLSTVVLLLAIAGAACGDDAKKKPVPAPEEPSAPRSVAGLDAVPGTARAVVGLNVPKLRDSALVQRALTWVLDSDPGLRERIEALLSSCGIDPGGDLVSVAIATGETPAQALMVVTGTLVEDRVATCVQVAMKAGGGDLSRRELGGRTAYVTVKPGGGEGVWFAFGAKGTVVASTTQDWLEAALGDGPKLSTSAWAAPLVERAGPTAGVWAVGAVEPRVGEGLVRVTAGAVKAPPTHMFAHLEVGDGMEAELGAVMATAADATAVADFGSSQLRAITMLAQGYGLGAAVSKVRIEAEATTAFLRLTLSADEVKEVVSQIDRAAAGE